MKKISAGIILYRKNKENLEVLLVHPGGPFWSSKDLGAWSIPKGEIVDNENALDAAIREFKEETGLLLSGNFIELSPVKLKSGKQVFAFVIEGDFNVEKLISNTCEVIWPPRSNKKITIPEVDKAGWFSIEDAVIKINAGQVPLIKELEEILKIGN